MSERSDAALVPAGRYTIVAELASGGMATVYLARLEGPGGFARTVAIKNLHAQFARDPEFVNMLLDEARLASQIRHPNVVAVLDVVASGVDVGLVLEYVAGESLARLQRAADALGEMVPVPIAVATIIEALQGLHAAHEARDHHGKPLGIVHRDVSPPNILVGADGVARILDFGIAKAIGRSQSTRHDQVKGKLGYMSPEQLGKGVVDRRTDVYAASIVLWELLAARTLFAGDSDVETFRNALDAQAPPLPAAIPALLGEAVMRGLAAAPRDRYPTAAAMAAQLHRVGPVAQPGEIAAWVERLVGVELARRAAALAGVDASEGPAASERQGGAAATSVMSQSRLFATAAREPAKTRPETPRPVKVWRGRPAIAAGALVAAAVMIAGLARLAIRRTPDRSCSADTRVDARHCGACGHDCLGGECRAGRCVPVLVVRDLYNAPYGIAIAGDGVYWASYHDGTVRTIRTTGEAFSQRIVARDQIGVRFVAVDGQSVYWTNYDGGSVGAADLGGTPLDPRPVRVLATGLRGPWRIAVDDSSVYVTVPAEKRILVLDKRTARTPRAIAFADSSPKGLVIDATRVYWTDVERGSVNGCDKSGSGCLAIAAGLARPEDLAADDTHLYVAEWQTGDVARVAKNGRPGSVVRMAHVDGPVNAIAVDGSHVFWTTASDRGSVYRLAKRGGTPEVIATQQRGPVAIALDGKTLWWTVEYAGAIMRVVGP